MKIGMVLEGGGMRGIYTAGVLDAMMDHNIWVDYVIGVSAGACHGVSYVSNQRGRSFRVNTSYLDDGRYIGISNFIKTRSIFGMDFVFDEVPHKLDPFSYKNFHASPCEFVVGVTEAESGQPAYFGKIDLMGECTVLRASSSIPVFAPKVPYKGKFYWDGGVTDPIPVKKAMEDGCDRIIVVLTRDRQYTKKPESLRRIYRRILRKYPNMIKALDQRHLVYKESTDYLAKLEAEGKALVIAPTEPLEISRFEKDVENLRKVYNLGMHDTESMLEKLAAFISVKN